VCLRTATDCLSVDAPVKLHILMMAQEESESAAASLSVIPEDSSEWLPDSPTLLPASKLSGKARPSECVTAPTVHSRVQVSTRSAGSTPLTALEVEWEGMKASEYVGKQTCSCACVLF